MNIDKDYEDILGKIEIKGCPDFTLDSKLRELSKQIPDNICGVYMFVEKKEMKTIYCISVVLVTLRTGNL